MYFVSPPYLLRKIYKDIIWNIPNNEKIIYLTFDDGPVLEVTPWVLDVLKNFNAEATFFCVGENIKNHPSLFKRIAAENHGIGNHTFNHLNGWKTSKINYIENVTKCHELVQSKLFRPPYGKLTPSQYSALNAQYSIIMWEVISGDFDQKLSPEKCFTNAIANTKSGSIVVFHDSLKAKNNLYYALPKFLEYFTNKGFIFKKIVA